LITYVSIYKTNKLTTTESMLENYYRESTVGGSRYKTKHFSLLSWISEIK